MSTHYEGCSKLLPRSFFYYLLYQVEGYVGLFSHFVRFNDQNKSILEQLIVDLIATAYNNCFRASLET